MGKTFGSTTGASIAALKASAPPSVVQPVQQQPKPTGSPQQQLVLKLPVATVEDLKAKAFHGKTTARALVLEALAKAGYVVPEGEAVDRRK